MGPTFELEVSVKFAFDAEAAGTAYDTVNFYMEQVAERIMRDSNAANPPPSFMRVCFEIASCKKVD